MFCFMGDPLVGLVGGCVDRWGVVLGEVRMGEREGGTKLSAECGQYCGVEYGQVWLYDEYNCRVVGGGSQIW